MFEISTGHHLKEMTFQMTISTITPTRSCATAIILFASALLLIMAVASSQLSDSSAARRAIVGAEAASNDDGSGHDDCANYRTARDQYESGDYELNNHIEQTFRNYAKRYADSGIRYSVGDEADFIAQMDGICK